MGRKIISIDRTQGPFQMVFHRVLRVVPDRDRADGRLRRLIAFRLRVDGEAETSAYLMRHIRDFARSRDDGPFYDFLTDPLQRGTPPTGRGTPPPGAA